MTFAQCLTALWPVATLDDTMMWLISVFLSFLDFSSFVGLVKQREETAIDFEVKTFDLCTMSYHPVVTLDEAGQFCGKSRGALMTLLATPEV